VPAVLGYNWLVCRNTSALHHVTTFGSKCPMLLAAPQRGGEPDGHERGRSRASARPTANQHHSPVDVMLVLLIIFLITIFSRRSDLRSS